MLSPLEAGPLSLDRPGLAVAAFATVVKFLFTVPSRDTGLTLSRPVGFVTSGVVLVRFNSTENTVN